MKKTMSFLLALALLISLIPSSVLGVSADETFSGSCGDNAYWSFEPDTGKLTISGTGPMAEFLSTNPQPWKMYRDRITAVVVEPGITELGFSAFGFCEQLRSVSLPNGLEKISSGAFSGCKSLEEIVLPDTVTKLERAFNSCSSLKRVTLSNGLQRIEDNTFSDCESLESISLPKALTQMDPVKVFGGCTSLQAFSVAEGNPAFSVDSRGLLYNGTTTKLLFCPAAVTGAVSVPTGVTEIGDSAFSGITGITAVSLPDSVKVIGSSAFKGCPALRAATIGKGVEKIGDHAFARCEALEQIELQGRLKSIGAHALYDCVSLTQITLPQTLESIGEFAFCETGLSGSMAIPASVRFIGRNAFDQCPNLQRFAVASGNTAYSCDDAGVLFDRDKTVLIRCPQRLRGAYSVPSGVVELADSSFDGCEDMTAIELPEGLQRIGTAAFRKCSALKELAFPASLSADSAYSSHGCESLERYVVAEGNPNFASDAAGLLYNKDKTMLLRCPQHFNGACVLPEGVSSCDSSAFHECRHMTSLSLPASWSYELNDWNDIFFYLSALQSISVSDEAPNVTSRDGVLYSKDLKRLIACPAGFVGVHEVAAETAVIEDDAFQSCDGLEAVCLPEGLKKIGDFAFFGCRSMKRITIPASVESIGIWSMGYWDPIEDMMKGMTAERVKGFSIYGYRDTAAYAFAEEESFDFYDLDTWVEGKTEFDDVSPNAWYAQPVHWAVSKGIAAGTGDERFSPKKNCTRAEVVTMLWRAMGSPEPKSLATSFTDVKPDAWYAKAVCWAVEAGITSGTSKTTFSPKQICTRAQVLTFLWKTLVTYHDDSAVEGFEDVKPDAWYAKPVAWALRYGITTGTSATTFSPNKPCTRAQVVAFLWQGKENYPWYFGRP